MSLRKELLERELKKLGFRKSEAGRGVSAGEGGGSQQEGQASHPSADDTAQHGD